MSILPPRISRSVHELFPLGLRVRVRITKRDGISKRILRRNNLMPRSLISVTHIGSQSTKGLRIQIQYSSYHRCVSQRRCISLNVLPQNETLLLFWGKKAWLIFYFLAKGYKVFLVVIIVVSCDWNFNGLTPWLAAGGQLRKMLKWTRRLKNISEAKGQIYRLTAPDCGFNGSHIESLDFDDHQTSSVLDPL